MKARARKRLLVLLVLLVFPGLALGGLAWYVRSGRLARRLEAEWAERYPGSLTLGAVELPAVDRTRLVDMVVSDGDHPAIALASLVAEGPPVGGLEALRGTDLVLDFAPERRDFLRRVFEALRSEEPPPRLRIALAGGSVDLGGTAVELDRLVLLRTRNPDRTVVEVAGTWEGEAFAGNVIVDGSPEPRLRVTSAESDLPVAPLRDLLIAEGLLTADVEPPLPLPETLRLRDLALRRDEEGWVLEEPLVLRPARPWLGVTECRVEASGAADGRSARADLELAFRFRDETGTARLRLGEEDGARRLACELGGSWFLHPLLAHLVGSREGVDPRVRWLVACAGDDFRLDGTDLVLDGDEGLAGTVAVAGARGRVSGMLAADGERVACTDLAVVVEGLGSLAGGMELRHVPGLPGRLDWEELDPDLDSLADWYAWWRTARTALGLDPGADWFPTARRLCEELRRHLPHGHLAWEDWRDPAGGRVVLTGPDEARLELLAGAGEGELLAEGGGLPMSLVTVWPTPYEVHAGTFASFAGTYRNDATGLHLVESRARLRDMHISRKGWHLLAETCIVDFAPGTPDRVAFRVPDAAGEVRLVGDLDLLRVDIEDLDMAAWAEVVAARHDEAQPLIDEIWRCAGRLDMRSRMIDGPDDFLVEVERLRHRNLVLPGRCEGLVGVWTGRLRTTRQTAHLDVLGRLAGGAVSVLGREIDLGVDRPVCRLDLRIDPETVDVDRFRLHASREDGSLDEEGWVFSLHGPVARSTGRCSLRGSLDQAELTWLGARLRALGAARVAEELAAMGPATGRVEGATFDLSVRQEDRVDVENLHFGIGDVHLDLAGIEVIGLRGERRLDDFRITPEGLVPLPATDGDAPASGE